MHDPASRALTVPAGAPVSRATSSTVIPTRWCSTTARRCAAGILRRASTRTTWSGDGDWLGSAAPCRTSARTPLRALRHLLAAMRHATVRTQAAAFSACCTCFQCCQARAYASWTHSSASARLPVIAYT